MGVPAGARCGTCAGGSERAAVTSARLQLGSRGVMSTRRLAHGPAGGNPWQPGRRQQATSSKQQAGKLKQASSKHTLAWLAADVQIVCARLAARLHHRLAVEAEGPHRVDTHGARAATAGRQGRREGRRGVSWGAAVGGAHCIGGTMACGLRCHLDQAPTAPLFRPSKPQLTAPLPAGCPGPPRPPPQHPGQRRRPVRRPEPRAWSGRAPQPPTCCAQAQWRPGGSGFSSLWRKKCSPRLSAASRQRPCNVWMSLPPAAAPLEAGVGGQVLRDAAPGETGGAKHQDVVLAGRHCCAHSAQPEVPLLARGSVEGR